MLIGVRHGETASNTGGEEKLRGWLPIPLTLEGMKSSAAVADLLKELKVDATHLYCSDLVRTVQSAHAIGMALDMLIEPLEDLRDFNTGDFAGSDITPELISKIKGYIHDPEKVIPGGESYESFLTRIVPHLTEWVESAETIILVDHGRVMTLLAALCKGKGEEPDLDTLLQPPPIDPSGLLIIGTDWTLHYSTPKQDDSNRQS